jgi:hypothetical protein
MEYLLVILGLYTFLCVWGGDQKQDTSDGEQGRHDTWAGHMTFAVVFLILYVDDILLIGNDIPMLEAAKTSLKK